MNITPIDSLEHQRAKAEYDTWRTRANSAVLWFGMNSAQIRQRARAGEQVFIDLLEAHSNTWDLKEPNKKAFVRECEIVQAEYGDVIAWPEGVAIARKIEPQA